MKAHCERSNDVARLKKKLRSCHRCQIGKAKQNVSGSSFESASYANKPPNQISVESFRGAFVDIGTTAFSSHSIQSIWMSLVYDKKSDKSVVFKQYTKLEHVTKRVRTGQREWPRTDGSGEYRRFEVKIHTQMTPETPWHNPFSERINLTLFELVRVVFEEEEQSRKYWKYAIECVSCIKNKAAHSGLHSVI